MSAVAPKISSIYASGRFQFKNWVKDQNGRRQGVKPHSHLSLVPADLINTTYANPNGLKTVFGIPFDLDAQRADRRWLDDEGRLDWTLMSQELAKFLPEVNDSIAYVVRSSGGRGLGVLLGIIPLPLRDQRSPAQLLAQALQARLIEVFNLLGFGADIGALGLNRDMPNFKDPARVIVANTKLLRSLERTSPSESSHLSTLLKECTHFLTAEISARRVYNDTRVETNMAKLMGYLLGEQDINELQSVGYLTGESVLMGLKDLLLITGLSKAFIRKMLKNPPIWLKVTCEGRGAGWRLRVDLNGIYFRHQHHRMDALLSGRERKPPTLNFSAKDLMLPEFVEDGERNAWLVRLGLLYKWHGYSEDQCLSKIKLRMMRISGISSSRNGAMIDAIIGSLYRNRQELFAINLGKSLPDWIEDDRIYEENKTLYLVEAQTSNSEGTQIRQTTPVEDTKTPPNPSLNKIDPILNVLKGDDKGKVAQEDSPSAQVTGAPPLLGTCVTNLMLLPKALPQSLGRIVGPDAHVPFLGQRYSVDPQNIGQKVLVTLSSDQVLKIYRGPLLIETHSFSPQGPKRITKTEHQLFPEERSVRQDGHVLFHGKYYSVGTSYMGTLVHIFYANETVTILNGSSILETHNSIQNSRKKSSTKPHHLEPWNAAQKDGSYYRVRAKAIGPHVEQAVLQIIKKGQGLVDTAKICCLLNLRKQHSAAAINDACHKVLQGGYLSVSKVKKFLLPTK